MSSVPVNYNVTIPATQGVGGPPAEEGSWLSRLWTWGAQAAAAVTPVLPAALATPESRCVRPALPLLPPTLPPFSARLVEGIHLMTGGKYAQAVNSLTAQVFDDSNCLEARVQRGFAYFYLGDLSAASADFRVASDAPDPDPRALAGLATLAIQTLDAGQLAMARRHIETARSIEKQRGGEASSVVRFAKALVLARSGEIDQSAKTLCNNLVRYPDDPFGQWVAGKLAEDRLAFSEALAAFRRACELDPENPLFITAVAVSQVLARPDAIHDFDAWVAQINSVAPESIYADRLAAMAAPHSQMMLDSMRRKSPNWEGALDAEMSAMRANCDTATVATGLNNALAHVPLFQRYDAPKESAPAQAIAFWETLAEETDAAYPHQEIASLYVEIDDANGAYWAAQDALTRSLDYRTLTTLSCLCLSRIPWALAFIEMAARLEPTLGVHLLTAADVAAKLGQWQDVIDLVNEYFARCLHTTRPRWDGLAHLQLGTALRHVGRYDEAREQLSRPGDPKAEAERTAQLAALATDIAISSRNIQRQATPVQIAEMIERGDLTTAIATLSDRLTACTVMERGHLLALRSLANVKKGSTARAYSDATAAVAADPQRPDPIALGVLHRVKYSGGAWHVYFRRLLGWDPPADPPQQAEKTVSPPAEHDFVEASAAF